MNVFLGGQEIVIPEHRKFLHHRRESEQREPRERDIAPLNLEVKVEEKDEESDPGMSRQETEGTE